MSARPCFEIKVVNVIRTGVATTCVARLSVVQDAVNPSPNDPPFVRTAYGFKTVLCDAGWDNVRLQQTLVDRAPQWADEIGPPVSSMPILCQLPPS